MSFGYDRLPRGLIGDTMILDAYLYDSTGENLVPETAISSVAFTVLKPTDTPGSPSLDAAGGAIVGDGHGQYQVDGSLNDVEGDYKGIATFIYSDVELNQVKSIMVEYSISDPFVNTGSSAADASVRLAWTMLEDCFDSEQGGPWLRDMTLNVFDQTKLRALVPSVIMEINLQMPFSNYTEATFPYTNGDGVAFVAQGLLVATIRHLMRSYTEQPDVVSSPVAFMDRKKYQQVWKAQYDVENELWKKILNRYKLQGYDLSSASLLLGTKAGRMLSGPMRSRNAGRGFF